MIKNIDTIKKNAIKSIQSSKDNEELRKLEITYLGRKSELINFSRQISTLRNEERPKMGKLINDVKIEIENEIELQNAKFEKEKMNNLAFEEWIDITAPSKKTFEGARHPISQFIDEIIEVFGRLGFTQSSGPELESEWYNFTALNLNSDHPAREMQDTFFIKDIKAENNPDTSDEKDSGMVLRTQTSNVQIRYMRNNQPPIRIIAPGKVYRKDSDATHSPMFHQVEGLMVDSSISLRNLKAVLEISLRELLMQPELKIRFRLSYFPFTEPSLELDISFPMKGKKDYWLEVGGAGMVHPNVLKNGNIDPTKYNGFAFGLGIDRLLMIKHDIHDLRLFFENDLRFLKQFA